MQSEQEGKRVPKLIRLVNAGRHKALFECPCGKRFVTYKYNVFSGHTKSCGCSRRKELSQSKTYKAYKNMKSRCLNPNTPYYYLYGGRGIKVCKRWLKSYLLFLEDLGERPGEDYSLDRIDVNGDYQPDNCRWVKMSVQANNRRDNHHLVHDGQSLTIQQWANKIGIKSNTLLYRIKRGWSIDRALTTATEVNSEK
jgi:hypothetical protein